MANILIVDDNPLDIQLLETAFRNCRSSITLHSVGNGVMAFEFLSKRGEFWNMPTPDLILLDLNLPVTNGKQILEVLQSDLVWKRIPVIILSGSHRKEDIDACYRKGASLYVVKPDHIDRYVDLAQSFAKLASVH
ncbi:MAG: response regulator [Planctomycetes bacterium]|nr:response regulator [Planctomycetota bacterium]